MNQYERFELLYAIALGMTKGTYPPTDYCGASIKHLERKTAERLKRWRE